MNGHEQHTVWQDSGTVSSPLRRKMPLLAQVAERGIFVFSRVSPSCPC